MVSLRHALVALSVSTGSYNYVLMELSPDSAVSPRLQSINCPGSLSLLSYSSQMLSEKQLLKKKKKATVQYLHTHMVRDQLANIAELLAFSFGGGDQKRN